MNLDSSASRTTSVVIRGVWLDLAHVELDTDDLHVIRHALNCYAETTSIPQHATPLRKLADLITEALKP